MLSLNRRISFLAIHLVAAASAFAQEPCGPADSLRLEACGVSPGKIVRVRRPASRLLEGRVLQTSPLRLALPRAVSSDDIPLATVDSLWVGHGHGPKGAKIGAA